MARATVVVRQDVRPRRVFSDGGDDRQRVWPACLAIVHSHTMRSLFLSLLGALRSAFRTHADLVVENLALRQELANFQRTSARPRLRKSDRAFWVVLSHLWSRWADALVVVKPDTIVRWHRIALLAALLIDPVSPVGSRPPCSGNSLS